MALKQDRIKQMVADGRTTELAKAGDPTLGPLSMLPGTWKNTEDLDGFGFNVMALPFLSDPLGNQYRLLMNQYNEELTFSVVDKGVPNRGRTVDQNTGGTDQTIVALEYFQRIVQVTSDDFPRTDLNGRFDGQAIHKEPGLWLYMTDHETAGINVARLGTIPHGNSFLAAGRVAEERWPLQDPDLTLMRSLIPNMNAVVVGGGENPAEVDLEPVTDPVTGVTIDYFAPYRHFHQNPFVGKGSIHGFAGFEPVHTTALLRHALENYLSTIGDIRRVMRLSVDSTFDHAGLRRHTHNGIVNIPFVVREAEAASMNATFLIYEIEDSATGQMRHFLQYAQNVILDFIGRPDGHPGPARWPHVSINTMERVADASAEAAINSRLR